jgi:hypothetical protein
MGGLLVAALVVVGLPVLAYVSVRGGDLARVTIAGDALVVRPRGLNRLWALKGEVRVRLPQVSQVRTDVPRGSVPSGLRVPGTYIPGLIQAGTYRKKGEKSFWLVGRAHKVTVIDCPGGPFDRIVLELSEEAAAELQRAVGRKAS